MNEFIDLIKFIYNNFLNIVMMVLAFLFILVLFDIYNINFKDAFIKTLSKSFKLEAFEVHDNGSSKTISNVYQCKHEVGNNIDSCNLYDISSVCMGKSDCSWNDMMAPSCFSKFYRPIE